MNHHSLIQSLCPIEDLKDKTGVHILRNFNWQYLAKWERVPLLMPHVLKWSMLFPRFDHEMVIPTRNRVWGFKINW